MNSHSPVVACALATPRVPGSIPGADYGDMSPGGENLLGVLYGLNSCERSRAAAGASVRQFPQYVSAVVAGISMIPRDCQSGVP